MCLFDSGLGDLLESRGNRSFAPQTLQERSHCDVGSQEIETQSILALLRLDGSLVDANAATRRTRLSLEHWSMSPLGIVYHELGLPYSSLHL